MLYGCHYKIFASLEWAFQMRKGVNLQGSKIPFKNIIILYNYE